MQQMDNDVYNPDWTRDQRVTAVAAAIVGWAKANYPDSHGSVYITVEEMADLCKASGAIPRAWRYLRAQKWLDGLCAMEGQPGRPLSNLALIRKMSTRTWIWKWDIKTEEDGA